MQKQKCAKTKCAKTKMCKNKKCAEQDILDILKIPWHGVSKYAKIFAIFQIYMCI